ncbi:MAG: ethanolamine ammonia-lyase [Methylomonas sp.]|nr:MAG: ethanolamine ammonia-lyase [Methylomonas sp.]
MSTRDPWFELRRYTQARIGQGRAGCATPTAAQLEFQLAHAMARDAVHQPWQVEPFAEALTAKGWYPLQLATAINDRQHYLQRPDLGRCLDQTSRDSLQMLDLPASDVALIVTNGLSSTAVIEHGLALLTAVVAAYADCSLSIGPICLVPNARVAVADEIGRLLAAKVSVIIVGERPGLSAADSLGMYLTYAPQPGKTDAERNCLSNIRPPAGMDYHTAAAKLAYLTQQALNRQISGVGLKDEMGETALTGNSDLVIRI